MNAAHFETVSDAALEQVNGGVTVSLSLDSDGISLDGPLGNVSIPNPFSLIGKAISGTLGTAGDLLSKLGGALTKAGQLFDFG
jgi:hypothetical protein